MRKPAPPGRAQFERFITDAVAALPREIRHRLNNVVIVLDDASPPGRLLGRYHGVPNTDRTLFDSGVLPDKITIFQRAIEREAATPGDLPPLVRRVVWHEIGHHFGFSERRIRQLERRWEQRDRQAASR